MTQVVSDRSLAADDPTAPPPGRARRVVLKLSGEVFGGGAIGVDPDVVQGIARQIATVVRRGVQVSVVVGGATSSAAPSCPSAAWTAIARTTWACSAP